MPQDLPRPVVDALRVLLAKCVQAAEESEEVRRSLETVGRYLTDAAQVGPKGASDAHRGTAQQGAAQQGAAQQGTAQHGVLTPAARKQGEPSRARVSSDAPGGRITTPLATVVTRARWKSAACRLSVERSERAASGVDQPESDALKSRESTLRSRLKSLPDTSTWMLDMPFGKRLSETDALEATAEQIQRLKTVADCYDAVAIAAEVAIELEEGGAFEKGPPPQFLYLMAEAQSSLLQSLALAPTRVDSDQRDIFLWLKDQTTRYRIYVDRFMRLDDPADPTHAAELGERIRRGARDVVADQKSARKRRELLSKVRYHAKKIREASALSDDEVGSLEQALAAWRTAGLDASDRRVQEALDSLRGRLEASEPGAARERLAGLIPNAGSSAGADGSKGEWAGNKESRAAPEGRDPVTLDELRAALASRSVSILVDAASEVDVTELESGIGGAPFQAVSVDLAGDSSARAKSLEEFLETRADVFLLGVKLPSEEYASFKSVCLEREVLFVRLPGPLETEAVLHQISRQVGWRLRARAPR